MNKQEKLTSILGIALLYTVITSIFSLLQKVNTAIFAYEQTRTYWFLRRNALWIIVIAAIVMILSVYIKKSNQRFQAILADHPMIGLAAGVLVVVKSISDLASAVPVNIISIQSVFESFKYVDVFLDGSRERMIFKVITTNALSIVIILCQLALGIFILKVYKKKHNKPNVSDVPEK